MRVSLAGLEAILSTANLDPGAPGGGGVPSSKQNRNLPQSLDAGKQNENEDHNGEDTAQHIIT